MRRMIFALGILALGGCHAPTVDPIPTYTPRSSAESLQIIRERSAQIHDISGQGDITLSNAAGDLTELDGVFVFAPPDRARVRAYKFGQAVLDLTVASDQTWLFLARSDSHTQQLRSSSTDVGRAIRQWLELLANPIGNHPQDVLEEPSRLIVYGKTDTGQTIVCTIDRATLTPREYDIMDGQGKTHFKLQLDAYRAIGPTIWPTRIRAISPNGTIEIELHDLLVNQAPAHAFDHPARAERLP